jgi:hypothetical protein
MYISATKGRIRTAPQLRKRTQEPVGAAPAIYEDLMERQDPSPQIECANIHKTGIRKWRGDGGSCLMRPDNGGRAEERQRRGTRHRRQSPPVKRRIRGQEHALAMAPRVTLLDALRERRRRRGQSGVIFGRIDIAFGLRAREK